MTKGRGRPKGAKGKKFDISAEDDSTKRDPSYWEHVVNLTSQKSVNQENISPEDDEKKKTSKKRKERK